MIGFFVFAIPSLIRHIVVRKINEIADKISFLNFSAMTVAIAFRHSGLDPESFFIIDISRVTLC